MKILAVLYVNNDTGMRMMGGWYATENITAAIHRHLERIDATLISIAEIEREDYNAYRASLMSDATTSKPESET